MGYACPVCGDPQADAAHLANHLAFTALVRGGDHEDWLDEHVPEWESMGEDQLGDLLVGDAEETEYPQVFEDTTGGADHDHDHDRARGMQDVPDALLADAERHLDDADLENPEDVLAEARELTRKRHADGDGDGDDADGDESAADSASRGASADDSESE